MGGAINGRGGGEGTSERGASGGAKDSAELGSTQKGQYSHVCGGPLRVETSKGASGGAREGSPDLAEPDPDS